MSKKLFITAVIIAFITSSSWGKDKGFTINGNITGIADSTMIYVHNMNTDIILDSTYVIGSRFKLSGYLKEVDYLWLYIEPSSGFKLLADCYIGNEDVTVSCDASLINNYQNTEVKGSTINDGFLALRKLTKPLYFKQDSIIESIGNTDSTQISDELKWKEVSEINNQIDTIGYNFVKENISTFYSIIKIYQHKGYFKYEFKQDSLLSFLQKFPKKARESQYGKAIKFYAQNSPVDVGLDFYDFKASDLNGVEHQLSDIKTDYIFLIFCRPRCTGCNYALEQLGEIKKIYQDSMTIVSFFVTGNKESWKSENEKFKIDWLSLSDLNGDFSETVLKYDINSYPTYFIIDKNRKVIDADAGAGPGNYLKNYMRRFFKKKNGL